MTRPDAATEGEEERMSEPTDALIEKMARAIADVDLVGDWEEANLRLQALYLTYARAAYEAEHEEDGK